MRILSRLSKGRTIASATVIALVAGVPIAFAIAHRGFPVTDVDLTARTVWVTNGEQLLSGRLNRQIEELDASVAAQSGELDVVQNGDDAFQFDPQLGTLERIDPAFTTLVEKTAIPVGAELSLGGSTLAITDPATGKLWILDVRGQLSFDPASDPDATLGRGGHAVATQSGKVVAVSPSKGSLLTFERPGAKPASADVDVSDDVAISAVGDVAAILDLERNRVVTGSGATVELPAPGLRVQQPGPEAAEVAVATGDALLLVPLGGGEPREVSADIGTPTSDRNQVAAPVRLEGCYHAAWSIGQRYLLACDGESPQGIDIEQPTGGGRLEFRVNRNVIALNNLDNGDVWLPSDKLRLVDNWDEVTPPEESETEEGDEKASTQSFEDTLAERTEQNRPPVARDDDMGVRPGRTTILAVLDNDTDPDGDVLTISKTSELPDSVGTLDFIEGGRALQFTSAPGKLGSTSFRYTVDDGRGGVAEATATIRIVPEDQNTAPVEVRTSTIAVELGATIEYNALTDWLDPDGDDLFLQAASPTTGDGVRSTPDGIVTFESRSGELGQKEVQLVVSDGQVTTAGTLVIDVKAPGTLGPIGTPDFATTFAGEAVVIEPTANDVSPTGAGKPKLVGVDQVPADVDVQVNLDKGAVTFTASRVGTYYFRYTNQSGAVTSVGIVRVDVLEDPDAPLPPIAVKDIAYLRAGEPTIVKVLNNDVSPSGRVIAIRSVDTSETAPGVSVEVLNNTQLRITSTAALTQQTQLTYRISDGLGEAVAGVTIVPVPPIVNRQPPIASDDQATVRAGDIVRVDVLANDRHPDQAQLILDPELVDTSQAGGGLVFVQDDSVRYQAPTTPGQYSIIYRVRDQYGESATAHVTFVVTAPDVKSDSPPVPVPQVARVFAGKEIRIDVPLDGIDPDGDSVIVTGITMPPSLGRVTGYGPNWISYQANPDSSGTDVLQYQVEDTYGLKGIGRISIGVIQPPDQAPPPNAVDDIVQIRPGRVASIPVLANDSDPSALKLKVSSELQEVSDGLDASVEDNQVVIQAPDTEGDFSLRYTITNTIGGSDSAYVLVKVTPDAPPLYPTAEDFYLTDDDVKEPDAIVVDVLSQATNPGGRLSDLEVTLDGAWADHGEVLPDGRIQVTQGETRIAIAYTVTNPADGLTATAFIVVPPAISASYMPPPYLDPELEPQFVDMNGDIQWDLPDIVVVPSGKPPILTTPDRVTAQHSDGGSLVVDGDTIRFHPAQDYRGPATITFEVTDGTSATDPNGRVATLTLGFTVGNPDFTDTPPTFTAQSAQVEPGEAPVTLDLRAATGHPNPAVIQQVEYTGLAGSTSNIKAELQGSNLVLSAPVDAPKGSTATITFTLRFRDFEVPGSVAVEVVASKRPLVQIGADTAKGQRTVTQSVDVLANDVNPFADQGVPLKLTDAHLENVTETSAQVSFTPAGVVTVKPDADFIGNVSVVYTVEDATKDKDRHVQGRLIITVRDVPSQPNPPSIAEGDQAVTVSWTPPTTNGEPIDSYVIRLTGPGAPGPVTVDGNTAQYQFSGLTNGQSYSANVTAHNVLGNSQTSTQSVTAVPYGLPAAPGQASVTPSQSGDGNLSFNWPAANGNGRTVSQYTWTVYSGATAVGSGTTAGTSGSWVGNVGTTYTVGVTATNPAGTGPESVRSAGAAPTPGAVSGVSVTIQSNTNTDNDATLRMAYGSAAAHGATPSYQCQVSGSGATNNCTASGWTFTGKGSTTYTLQVRACVGSVCGPWAQDSVTTREKPPSTWHGYAGTGTCPEQGTSSHFDASGPSCSSAHGFANGDLTLYCYTTWPGWNGNWYLFSGDGYSKGEGWYVKGSTIDIDGSPSHC